MRPGWIHMEGSAEGTVVVQVQGLEEKRQFRPAYAMPIKLD
jgi:hypothetical protein